MNFVKLRLIPLLLTALAALLCAAAFQLPAWANSGPGPGLMPRAIALVFLIFCAAITLFPGKLDVSDDEDPSLIELGPAERRVVLIYGLSFLLIVVGVYLGGFIATTILTSLIMVWWAEKRPLRDALLFSVGFTLITSLIFGSLLGVQLPSSPIDETFLAAVESARSWIW